MTDWELTGTLTVPPALSGTLTAPAALAGSLGAPAALTGTLGVRSTLTGALTAPSALTGTLVSPLALEGSLDVPRTLTGTLEGNDMELWLATVELGAERARRDIIRLASWAVSIPIHTSAPTPVELPTGLVLYPTLRDSGFIEIKVSFSHANMSATTVTFDLWVGPVNALAKLLTITSPAFAAGGGNLTGEFLLRVTPRGPSAQSTWASLSWRDGASVNNYIVFPGRLTPFADFGNAANGDNGDVEVHLECSISSNAAGQVFNVVNTVIEQHSPRSGTQ